MSQDEVSDQVQTPLQLAARNEARPQTQVQDARDEHEADVLVADIDDFVAKNDPDHLQEAQGELNAWEIPSDPLNGPIDGSGSGALVSVFSAYSEPEANIVKGVLDAAGIPSDFDNHGGGVMGGIFASGEAAWAEIVVPESYAEAARAAIAEASVPEAEPSEQ